MITREPIPLAIDRLWRERFNPSDRALRLPADLTGATAQVCIRKKTHRPLPSDWWYGETGGTIIGTDTGEITNAGNHLSVIARLAPGLYTLEGEYTKDGNTVPFITGELCLTDYASQLALLPVGEV